MAATHDSAVAAAHPRPDTQRVAGPVLAARYFSAYDGNKDPVEVSYYYDQYRKHRYSDVLDAKPIDYQVLGVSESKNARLSRYMLLYKGLCLLEDNQPAKARGYLDSVWKSAAPADPITFTAQWYSLLAALRQGDQPGIQDLAGRLIHRPNPYQERARKILQELL